jgi:hypothetical protein
MLLFIGQGDSLIGVSMDNCEKEGCLPSVLWAKLDDSEDVGVHDEMPDVTALCTYWRRGPFNGEWACSIIYSRKFSISNVATCVGDWILPLDSYILHRYIFLADEDQDFPVRGKKIMKFTSVFMRIHAVRYIRVSIIAFLLTYGWPQLTGRLILEGRLSGSVYSAFFRTEFTDFVMPVLVQHHGTPLYVALFQLHGTYSEVICS